MRLFEIGQEVLFYRDRNRVYGFVAEYVDDNNMVIDVPDEYGDMMREVIAEMFVREADDPDDPEGTLGG